MHFRWFLDTQWFSLYNRSLLDKKYFVISDNILNFHISKIIIRFFFAWIFHLVNRSYRSCLILMTFCHSFVSWLKRGSNVKQQRINLILNFTRMWGSLKGITCFLENKWLATRLADIKWHFVLMQMKIRVTFNFFFRNVRKF